MTNLLKTYRLKCFMVDDRPQFVEQKRFLGFLWLTPYLVGNFGTGFYNQWRLFDWGGQYSWYETPPRPGYKDQAEHNKVMYYYD